MNNIGQMMKQAQQMKEKLAEMQEKVMKLEVSGESAAGMVRVVVTGKGELKSLKLDPAIVDPSDIELLEDVIVAAVNDARKKAEEKVAEETSKIMQDLGLPPGMELPF